MTAPKIKLFESREVRAEWDEDKEKWWFSVVDIVAVLTDSDNPRKYWSVLKTRLRQEGSQLATNCSQLKLASSDGKKYLTDVADTEQILRLIQSIPSKKAEPFKLWLAQVGSERIDETVDPELSIDRAIQNYRRLGYSENWINQRIKSIEVRKALTDEWDKSGVLRGQEYAALTDLMSKTWSGLDTREYKRYKGLKKENLRDNMTNTELVLNMLAEVAATDISLVRNPQGLGEAAKVAVEGAKTAKAARLQLEKSTGKPVVSALNAKATRTRQISLVPTVGAGEVAPEVARMLRVLEGDMSREQIMALLGLKDEKHFRVHYQQAGIASGLIEMTLPDKPRSSKQRYRLTPIGKQWLTGDVV